VIVDFSNKELVFDTEANNLLDKVTKMWCIYIIDLTDKKGYLFHDFPEYDGAIVTDDGVEYVIPVRTGTLAEGARSLFSGKRIIAHNIMGYDLILMNMFFPKFNIEKAYPKCHDTLIQSKVQKFDRRAVKGYKGIHGLDPWGGRLGHNKPKVVDWSTIDPFKLHRCIVDVNINVETFEALEKERLGLLKKGIDFSEGAEIDKLYKLNTTYQEIHGAAFASDKAKACVKELDSFILKLTDELEPNLPPTVKIVSQKCTWNETAETLGWDLNTFKAYSKHPEVKGYKYKDGTVSTPCEYFSNRVKYELRERLGVVKSYPLKTAAKPTTKLTVANGNYGKHIAEFFDIEPESFKTTRLVAGPFSKVGFTPSKMSQHEVVKNFLLKYCGWVPTEYNYKKDKDGRLERDDNYKLIETSPKLTEDSFKSIKGGIGVKIAEYNTYSHRRRFLENEKDDEKGLLNLMKPDGRIPCGVNVFGTATGRSSQFGWVNAPGGKALYGDKIRSLIVAPKGRILVASDMKSAQLSIAGYYARNKAYLDAVLEGQEFKLDEHGQEILHPKTGNPWYIGESGHCVNARAFGVITDEDWHEARENQDPALIKKLGNLRSLSKGGSFATIFGATGKKVATTLGIPEKQGDAARNKFLADVGLDEPIAILSRMAKDLRVGSGSYIELPFGYWAWCKSPHKFFNYLDQGTEAACQKVAVNHFESESKRLGLDCFKILDIHDEFMVESDIGCQQEVGALMCESYKYASDRCLEWHQEQSKYFINLEFPFNLDGGYKVGENYYDVH